MLLMAGKCGAANRKLVNYARQTVGGGLYRSADGGRTWKNLYRCYIRAIWVDPANAQHIVAGPADGVSRNGPIEESYDGGQTWHLVSDGMRSAPWSRHMVERLGRKLPSHALFRYVQRVHSSTITHVSVSPPFHPARPDFPDTVGDHSISPSISLFVIIERNKLNRN